MHETWTCEDDDYGYGYGRRRWAWGYEDEDEDDDDDDAPEDGPRSDENGRELIELVDGSVELRHWVGAGSRRAEAIAARVDDSEVCYTKPSVDCEPFESEYEGFTGAPIDDVVEVSNYAAALEHALARLAEGFPLSNRLLRETHEKLLSSGRGADKQPGEFRTSQNWIGGTRPGNAQFVPPPPTEVEPCMAALERPRVCVRSLYRDSQ